MEITPLNQLPVIVCSVGIYKTRKGDVVMVHEVKDNGDGTDTRFSVKGTLRRLVNVRHRNTFNIWHVSGRLSVWHESPDDIICKIK